MSASWRKARPLNRVEGRARDARLIIVAVEDTYIQKPYFLKFRSTRMQIEVLPTREGEGKSSPAHVLQRLSDIKELHEWEKEDEFWLSIDVDRWEPRMLKEVYAQARQKGFRVVATNPCFEFWLQLHIANPTVEFKTCTEVVKELKSLLKGYNKRTLPEGLVTVESVNKAIKLAADLPDANNEIGWPTKNGAQVYRLAQRLIEFGADLPR